jgi:hypothetical protein
VTGVPSISGPEAAANTQTNSFELRWATPEQFGPLNLRPAAIHELLTTLCT